jgi:hypothetical protein
MEEYKVGDYIWFADFLNLKVLFKYCELIKLLLIYISYLMYVLFQETIGQFFIQQSSRQVT